MKQHVTALIKKKSYEIWTVGTEKKRILETFGTYLYRQLNERKMLYVYISESTDMKERKNEVTLAYI